MLRFSLLALTGMLIFGLVFALLPASGSARTSGVTLQGVKLKLYPAQDANAEWRFSAAQIDVDPEKNETALDQLGQGARWVRAPSVKGNLGALRQDMRIKASQLVIDSQDNLRAQQAELYTLADCSTFTLSALGEQQVLINQQGGYSAPKATISSTILSGEYRDINSNFDFTRLQFGEQLPGAEFKSVAGQRCVGGKLQPR